VCGYLSGSQENWLITQFINTTGVQQNFIVISIHYLIKSKCTLSVGCELTMEVYALQTNESNQSIARNISNFIHSSATNVAYLSDIRNDHDSSFIPQF